MEDSTEENEKNANSQLFTESVQFCIDYLKSNNYIADQNVHMISDHSKSIGLDLAMLIIDYMESLQKVESDELFIEESDESMEVVAAAEGSDNVQIKNTPELSESSPGMSTL